MKKIFFACLSVLTAVLCFGCSAAIKTAEEKETTEYQSALPLRQLEDSLDGKTIIYSLNSDPGEKINPVTTQSPEAEFLFQLMYQPLFESNSGKYTMRLAESVEKQGDCSLIVKLKDDIVWSDAVPVTADDVVFTYELIQKEETSWAYSHLNYPEGTVRAEQVDAFTVQFTFPFQHIDGMAMLADILILPKHIFDVYNEDYTIENSIFWKKKVGCGPYIVADYAPGAYFVFESNPYFKETSPFDADHLIAYNSKNTRQAAADAAEHKVDIAEIPAWDLRILKKKTGQNPAEAGITMEAVPADRLRYLGINGARIRDHRIREAIFYSLDRRLINESGFITPNYYHSESSFIPESSPYYNADTANFYPWDLKKAEELLADFDLESFVLTLAYCSNDDSMAAQAVMIKDLLALSNIQISLKKVKNRIDLYQYDLFLDELPCAIEPDLYSKYFGYGSKQNIFNYYNPEVEALFEKGRSEKREDDRKNIYDEIQLQIAETAYIYPLCTYSSLLLSRPD